MKTVNPGLEKDYALDFLSVVRHIVTEMGGAKRPLPISEMAESCRNLNPSDLSRVRHHHELTSNTEAVEFLVERAVAALGQQVEQNGNGGYKLTRPVEKVTYQRRKIYLYVNDHAQLRDPFNPMTERPMEFRKLGSLGELKESMREFGWIEYLPAIQDERGVTIMGHRRLQAAKELRAEGIEMPDNIKKVRFGVGDESDAKRFRLAIASNLGAKSMTPGERQHIAEYLYGERDWTMERIAQALNVSTKSISRDLTQSQKRETRGRPRKATTPEQEEEIATKLKAGQTQEQIAEEMGFSRSGPVRRVSNEEVGKEKERTSRQESGPSPNKHCPTCTCSTIEALS